MVQRAGSCRAAKLSSEIYRSSMDGMTGVILLFAMVVDERGPDGVFSLSPGALPRAGREAVFGEVGVCVWGGDLGVRG